MVAVIRTGGKQYRVAQNDVIKVERLAGEAGDIVVLDDVLAVGSEIGKPGISGASVAARILGQDRNDRIITVKRKRRHTYKRRLGHRQEITVLRIEEILTGGAKPTVKPGLPEKAPKKAKAEDAEPATDVAVDAPAEATEAKAKKKSAKAKK